MTAAAGGKNIRIVGDGGLAGRFFDAGPLDELSVQIGSLNLAWGTSAEVARQGKPAGARTRPPDEGQVLQACFKQPEPACTDYSAH